MRHGGIVLLGASLAIVTGLAGLLRARHAGTPDLRAASTPGLDKRLGYVALAGYERALRALEDPRARPPSDAVLGPEPYRVVALDRGAAGILRFDRALVLLDDALAETARVTLDFAPTALARDPSRGELWVGGEHAPYLVRFDAGLREIGRVTIPSFDSVRDVAVHPRGSLVAIDDVSDQLAFVSPDGEVLRRDVPAQPVALAVTDHFFAGVSVAGHAFWFGEIDDGHAPGVVTVVARDAPLFAVAAREDASGAFAFASGIEDAPLDRTIGAFGNVDSFVHGFDLSTGTPTFSRNVSELGVVTPKALAVHGDLLRVVGYGSRTAIDLDARGQVVRSAPIWPGTSAIAPAPRGGFFVANTLADAWGKTAPGKDVSGDPTYVAAPRGPIAARRTAASRLGEALVFTSALAPFQDASGPKSRFTCEACHFEGQTDGRTHHTGRGDVAATTKPLFGLFTNAPHFTRALDTTTTRMIFAELRVAAARGHGPAWFDLRDADAAWTGPALGVSEDTSALALRAALLAYLIDATPRPNPRARDRTAFDADERAGAAVFAQRCEGCHAARTIADDAATRVAPADWEPTIFATPEAIVWARDGYEKTGVVPYVHDEGARPTSLRRLDLKRRYFTHGAARSLADVLDRASFGPRGFTHDGPRPPGAEALDDDERRVLLAFLRLL